MKRALVVLLLGLSVPAAAWADEPVHAREQFVRGVELAKRAQWAEARSAFETSMAERPHPVTRYNLALCDRALGELVRAVHELTVALDVTGPDALSGETRSEAARLRDGLAPQRAFVDVTRAASDTIRVDGRLLERIGNDFTPAHAQDVPSSVPVGKVHVALDLGVHDVRVERDGHTPAMVRVTLVAGDVRSFVPHLVQRPGLLFVTATPAQATARIDGRPAVALPISLPTPGGSHRVEVALSGYQPFSTQVWVRPDVRSNVHAELSKTHVSVFKRWWFWTAVGGALVTAGVVTYALTRPEATPGGGSLDWVARP